jgi:hypothetical protein
MGTEITEATIGVKLVELNVANSPFVIKLGLFSFEIGNEIVITKGVKLVISEAIGAELSGVKGVSHGVLNKSG